MSANAVPGLENFAASAQTIAARPIRILIADDHASLRQTLRQVLESVPGVELLGDAGFGSQPVESPETQADVVLSDLDLAAAISYYSGIKQCKGDGTS